VPERDALVVIPTYLREPQDLAVTMTAIESVFKTQKSGVQVLCVDDGSPSEALVDGLEAETQSVEGRTFELIRKEENTGFSRTVNVGLKRALEEGRDAVLLNADMEIQTSNWLKKFRDTTDPNGNPAGIVGALLLFPNGTIQHAGVYFSALTRTFDHMYKYGPGNLPEAVNGKRACPVTGAFQFIRHEVLEDVGLYDENFSMGWEDVDHCIRTFLAGHFCIYNPNVRGIHYESMFRGRPSEKVRNWQAQSWAYLMLKYANLSFAGLVPFQE
jgi:GT2 family glycosyltransferase